MTHAVSDGTIGALTSRSAALDRNSDVPTVRRALAAVVSVHFEEPARGVASGTAAAALLLRLLGEGALRC
jgi:hypothetical protein